MWLFPHDRTDELTIAQNPTLQVLKAVVARFNAADLIEKREEVSQEIRTFNSIILTWAGHVL